ncbi:hypothetical protein D3C84_558630 [compost metagenome]
MIVDQLHGFFQAVHANDAQYRAEDLFFIDAHVRGDVVEQATTQEEAFFITWYYQTTTIDHQFGAGLHAVLHVACNLVASLAGHQWAHVQTARSTCTDFQRLDLRYQFGNQCIGNLVTHANGNRNGHATLAARTVGCAHQCAHGVVQVGIGHQYRVILCPAQCLHALAAFGAFAIDVLGNRR